MTWNGLMRHTWYFARFGTICKLKKNVKNSHGGVLLLVKLQALTCKIKLTLVRGCFSRFLNCADGNKSRKASHFLCTSVHRCKMSWQIALLIYMWFWIAYPYGVNFFVHIYVLCRRGTVDQKWICEIHLKCI